MTVLYLEPRTLEEAVAALAEHGDAARVVAGGTDLVVLARKRRAMLADVLVALHRIDDINGIELEDVKGAAIAYGGPSPFGGLRIGAATPHATIEHHPSVIERFTALADGSALVGSPATRHVGTIGGNLANASPANDTGSPLLVFDASVDVWSASGVRNLALADFFAGPGRTALRPGEILSSVVIPRAPSTPAGSAYIRLDYRQAMEIAVVGAAATVRPLSNARGWLSRRSRPRASRSTASTRCSAGVIPMTRPRGTKPAGARQRPPHRSTTSARRPATAPR